ncbi:MAG: molybdopterin cofactor-binding domain-containing protein [Bacillota bacterium]
MEDRSVIGRSVPRHDAVEKVTGQAVYAGDLDFPGLLHGKVLRSPYPHARVLSIDTGPALALKGVRAVLTARDIPGINRYGLAVQDQQALAAEYVRYRGDPVAAVAADTEEIALDALERIRVEYRELPGVFCPLAALEPGAPLVHEGGNLLQHTKIRKGDVDVGFSQAAVIVENEYRTHLVEHAYMEPEVSVARLDAGGTMTVWTSTQYPFRDRRQLAPVLNMPVSRVRVVQMTTGGGFGGKDDITTEMHACLLALKTRRPVRVRFDRAESFLATTKRHPVVMRCRTGATSDGRLTAVEGKVYGDTGAYCSLGIFVIKKCGIHLPGPYYVPNIKVDTFTVYTNNPISGAMRGFGVVQAAFAHESQMDLLAEKLGITPYEIRVKNALDVGLSTSTGQVLEHSVGIKATLEAVRAYLEATGRVKS